MKFDGYTPWRERVFLNMKTAAEVIGVSPASLYAYAKSGDIVLEKLAGRTVIRPSEILKLAETRGVAWTESDRGKVGRTRPRAKD